MYASAPLQNEVELRGRKICDGSQQRRERLERVAKVVQNFPQRLFTVFAQSLYHVLLPFLQSLS